ncbi:MAG: ribonuclease P protein component [Flavobacteriaceae bacterium]|nr:ribonuclease P protein component [Flavobacteriaceae bacterium]
MKYRFQKEEKLKSRKLIERLFSEGKSVSSFPVKVFFLPLADAQFHQATFAVPKRSFKLAVARNRIKRQMREAYRLHKHLLSHNNGPKFALLFLYISKDKPQYAHVISSMKQLLNEKIA